MGNNISKFFGQIEPGKCKLTMNGNIAIQVGGAYKTYNVAKGTLTNVTNFCFDPGFDMFFVMPTNKVKEGDIVLIDGKPKCVIETDKKTITVIDYESAEIKKIVPERHVFMGNTIFYAKIVNMFGNSFKGGKGMNGMLKMMMASKLMAGNTNSSDGGMFGNMGQLLAMNMMMGGGNDMFGNMFSELELDSDSDDEDDEDTLDEEV